MKIKTITTCSNRAKCHELERSLQHFDYDYHIIEHPWTGFLSKLHETHKYLKMLATETTYTHFLYTDAWDTFALASEQALYERMPNGLMLSAERACYPHPEKAPLYPPNPSPWKYVNGGGWAGEITAFLSIYEQNPPKTELNDQVYLTDRFLALCIPPSPQGEGRDEGERPVVKLDYDCTIFQTIAFCPETDFEVRNDAQGIIKNTVTGNYPIFFHGNGHTPMPHIYKLL
jgi:hypothetical protein